MPSPQLPNYLRSNRKRSALSQDEVAFLLGIGGSSKVCRDELFVREPSLMTALAYEAIFQKPVRELFAGLYHEVELAVAGRAQTLQGRFDRQKHRRQTDRKLQAVARISRTSSEVTPNS